MLSLDTFNIRSQIYRLYLIWNSSKSVTYIPILASLVNSGKPSPSQSEVRMHEPAFAALAVIGIRLSYAVDESTVALHFTIYQLYLALNVVLNILLTAMIGMC
jgi:hypothetical protein